ncbi:ATP-binding protein [Streptomyces sp. NPDC058220]|uniref:ATP-binding protein n=1 Tax=Streptomyces sp. NPDC058220 TaxID=3346387 RepID=UPI0036F0D983
MTTTDLPAPPTGDLFELRFSSTARGARLARRLASHRVHTWGHRYGTEVNDTVSLIVGELTVNAVTHGRAPGRDARLRLVRVTGERLRVEVTDTRGERMPAVRATACDEEAGAGWCWSQRCAGSGAWTSARAPRARRSERWWRR